MFEVGKRYRTRDGSEARVYATDGGPRLPIHGAIRTPDIFGQPFWRTMEWWPDGRRYQGPELSKDDLVGGIA